MTTYKPIFNHAAIKAAKKQEKKEKTITAVCAVIATALIIARPFILGAF